MGALYCGAYSFLAVRVLKGLHQLRHSFVSCLNQKGVRRALVNQIAGHVTQEMGDHYDHSGIVEQKTAILKLVSEDKKQADSA